MTLTELPNQEQEFLQNEHMENKNKQLLLKVLCTMLPYNIIVNIHNGKYREDVKLRPFHLEDFERWDIKPYLRPMSSMIGEELKEFSYTILQQPDLDAVRNWQTISIDLKELPKVLDWFNKKKFDYYGLIPMGLALPASEGMYKKGGE